MLISPVEEIKNRIDIVDLVKEYVQLQKAGANFRAPCPFHVEKSPSFFVSPARQLWHCFGGCGEGGDIFKFVMKIESIEFGDALRMLAKKAGVELPKRDASFVQWETEKKKILDALELAAKFYEKQLEGTGVGAEAKAYILGRGITQETLKKWRIGYAPDSARSLYTFLFGKGCKEYDVAKAGLLLRSGNDTYDRFRGRIMFPIFDTNSQVIGFGGRIINKKEGKDLAKYLNTSNTPVYDKSKVLYGLDKAKHAIRRQNFIVMVEGYVDAIMASQAGTENVVATSGTALTESHLRLLKRYSENLRVSFDGDMAGQTATRKGIDKAIAEGFQVRVVMMPKGSKDPADVAKENPEEWMVLVEGAKSVYDFYFESSLLQFDKKTIEGKKGIANIILPVIKKLPSKIEQDHWISRLAEVIDAKEESVREELLKLKEEPVYESKNVREGGVISPIPAFPAHKSRKEMLEERALSLLFRIPKALELVKEEDLPYFSLETQELFAGFRRNPSFDMKGFEGIFPSSTLEKLTVISLRSEIFEQDAEEAGEFESCLKELKAIYNRERLEAISKEIKTAEAEQNVQRLQELMKEFDAVSRSLHFL